MADPVAGPAAALGDLLGAALIGLMREHRTAVARELAPLGLHVGQEILLDAIVRAEGLTQADLSRAMGVEPPTVTKMLQRLAGSGLVQRQPDPRDRRQVRVWPTDLARGVHAEMLRRWAAVDARMLAGIPPAQQAALRGLLSAMTANLAVDHPADATPHCPAPPGPSPTDRRRSTP